ncbi:MAG: class I SAM-dependent methyltransferase [Chloroflexi bacterium]|nr:class I SAM-dependent methyltransferase [Chloroflexota bacterium]
MRETDEKHWTHTLSVEHPEVYLPFLEKVDNRAEAETSVLVRLLDEQGHGSGSSLLDAPCGIGRHSLRLARLGFDVTGIDLSQMYVDIASRKSETEGGAVKFFCADIQDPTSALGHRRDYDIIINMFTSIGYFGKSGDITMFRRFRDVAADKATLIVQTANRDWIVQDFEPEGMDWAADLRIIQNRIFEFETSTILNNWEFWQGSGPDIRHRLSIHKKHRVYSLHEMVELLEQTGWNDVQGYGASDAYMSDLKPMQSDSKVMWLVARAR